VLDLPLRIVENNAQSRLEGHKKAARWLCGSDGDARGERKCPLIAGPRTSALRQCLPLLYQRCIGAERSWQGRVSLDWATFIKQMPSVSNREQGGAHTKRLTAVALRCKERNKVRKGMLLFWEAPK